MGTQDDETRRDRIDRLKGKFMGLPKIRRIIEYERYRKARDGELSHPYPQEYVEDVAEALEEMVMEDYPSRPQREHLLELVRKRRPTPFMQPTPSPKPKK